MPADATDSVVVSRKDGELIERFEYLHPPDLVVNRARKRAICGSFDHPGYFTLLTFRTLSQEEYKVIRDDRVSRRDAWAWLRGADSETFGRSAASLASGRAIRRARDVREIIEIARKSGMDEAAAFIEQAWDRR